MTDQEAYDYYADPAHREAAGPGRKHPKDELTEFLSARISPSLLAQVTSAAASEEECSTGRWVRRALQNELGRSRHLTTEMKPGKGPLLKVICTQPHDAERDTLAGELASLRADIAALRPERDEATALTRLRGEVDKLKREKATLTEDSARKIRETEHKTGLLKTKQEHDVEHARRMAVLEVREENLAADRERFEAEMKFQRDHFDQRADKQDEILKAILERLPAIDVALNGAAAPRARSMREKDNQRKAAED